MRILTAVYYRYLLEMECGWGGGTRLDGKGISLKCALCEPLANMKLMELCNHCQSGNNA